VLVGLLVFCLACRWIGWPTALFGIYLLMDVPFALLAPNPTLTPWFPAINYPVKFLTSYFGGRTAAKGAAAQLV